MSSRLAFLILIAALLPAPGSRAITIVDVGAPGAPGEDGEPAEASALETDPLSPTVAAQATGGQGGAEPGGGLPAGNGGGASVGPVHGASTSGAKIWVVGSAVGGRGGPAAEAGLAGDGASVEIVDAVEGETTGTLGLSQLAQGGPPGLGGTAGDAASVLDREVESAHLELVSRALGGGTWRVFERLAIGGGGDARASGRGTNHTGSVRVRVQAEGGPGSLNDPDVVDGGSAEMLAFGSSAGDGHPVVVGDPPIRVEPGHNVFLGGEWGEDRRWNPFLAILSDRVGAWGGNGRNVANGTGIAAGDGGDARSVSVGLAEGESPVVVVDTARGGDVSYRPHDDGPPRRGGDASSDAFASSLGAAPVFASALSAGGIGYGPAALRHLSGAATSLANAAGRGPATAESRAHAGFAQNLLGTSRASGGAATAVALSHGATSLALAEAQSRGSANLVTSRARAERAGQPASARASADAAAPLPQHPGPPLDASAAVVSDPNPRELARELRRHRALEAELDGTFPVALGRVELRQGAQGPGTGSSTLAGEVETASTGGFIFSGPDPSHLALFDVRATGRGFEALRVLVVRGSQVLFDATFTDPRAAREALEGLVVAVPFGEGGFRVVAELTAGERPARFEASALLSRGTPPHRR